MSTSNSTGLGNARHHSDPTPSITPHSLLGLPAEIHFEIADYLPLQDRVHLRAANKHFRALIPEHTYAEMLEAEKGDFFSIQGKRRSLYACGYCLRFYHTSRFDDDQTDPFRASSRTEASRIPMTYRGGSKRPMRFCLACGLGIGPRPAQAEGYVAGEMIRYGVDKFVVCTTCRLLFQPADGQLDRAFCRVTRACSRASQRTGRLPVPKPLREREQALECLIRKNWSSPEWQRDNRLHSFWDWCPYMYP